MRAVGTTLPYSRRPHAHPDSHPHASARSQPTNPLSCSYPSRNSHCQAGPAPTRPVHHYQHRSHRISPRAWRCCHCCWWRCRPGRHANASSSPPLSGSNQETSSTATPQPTPNNVPNCAHSSNAAPTPATSAASSSPATGHPHSTLAPSGTSSPPAPHPSTTTCT